MKGKRAGLRVAYHDHVERLSNAKRVLATVPAGWFIEVLRNGKWVAIMDLRFVRQKDALRAVCSLTVAGLSSYHSIKRVNRMTIKQVACEFLQW